MSHRGNRAADEVIMATIRIEKSLPEASGVVVEPDKALMIVTMQSGVDFQFSSLVQSCKNVPTVSTGWC